MTEAANRPTPGTPCWVSLMVHDLPAAERFYSGVFGWQYSSGPTPLGPYVRALQDGRPVAGLNAIAPQLESPAAWLPHIATDNADLTADTIRGCGGTVAVGPLDAAEEGRMAVASDTGGAVFGIWQARRRKGISFGPEVGSPMWTELITSDTAMVSKFYELVFGYQSHTARTVPGADRLTLYLGDRPVGGIRGVEDELPRDRGSHWLVYFSVPDADGAAARLEDLGGQVLEPPEVTPIGRVIRAADPEGAPFALLQRS
jgi:predicted enzyme related to lactoylglutathione lyase